VAQVTVDEHVSRTEPVPMAGTVRCRLLGAPLSQSLSPGVHRCFAEQRGISIDYEPVETHLNELRERLAIMRGQNIRGVNLTIPLKEMSLEFCDSISPRARACGAVNVLTATPDGWQGDNTDGSGFWRDLFVRHRFQKRDPSILVIGSGGAARGIIGRLLAESLDVTLGVRHYERGKRLVESMQKHYGSHSVPVYDLRSLPTDQTFHLIINATSAGLMGMRPDVDTQVFARHPWVYDISYGPTARSFLTWAARQGASHVTDGLGMLIEQASEAFTLWTGWPCETDPVYSMFRSRYPL